MARYRIALVAMLAVIAIPTAALAGGWAIASFDEVPGDVQAGSTYDLSYTVLQHGQTPVNVGDSQVRIIDSNGTVTAFDAVPTGETGRYSVAITFPESGTWQWEVDLGDFGPYQIGTVEVAPAISTSTATGSALRWLLPTSLVIVIGLIALQVANLTKARGAGRPIRAD